jgi:hypothetical protein
MSQNQGISSCIEEAWKLYHKYKRESRQIVVPSMPIIFFGDYDLYRKSKLKIITVGLNPSTAEFKPRQDPPFGRFRQGDWLERTWRNDEEHFIRYLEALRYFDFQPYKKWFNTVFEPKLHVFNSSYYPNNLLTSPNKALHTDICSPVATTPDWGDLERNNAEAAFLFRSAGTPLWLELVKKLQPDMILASVREDLLRTAFPLNSAWSAFSGISNREAKWKWILSDSCLLIQGRITYWDKTMQVDLAKRALRILGRN